MMKSFTRGLVSLVLAVATLFCGVSAVAQSNQYRGRVRASDYQYTILITTGTSASGAGSITIQSSTVTLTGGKVFYPFVQNGVTLAYPQVQIVDGSSTETVTLTAIAGCGGATISSIPSCTLTFGSSSYAHGAGAWVRSGTGGAQEAILDLTGNGGVVQLDSTFNSPTTPNSWSLPGGSTPVTIEDLRYGGPTYWGNKPTVLTLISAPAAPTVALYTGGAMNTGAYYTQVTYVDALGGESLSTESSSTTTTTGTTLGLTVTSPAASTGAVGYRVYVTAAAGGSGTEILAAPTCTAAPNTWLPNTCALGSNAVVTANPTTTAKIPVESTAHTVINPQPFSTPPPPFQTVFGPFAATGTLNSSNADAAVVNIPASYFNTLNKSWEICVKGTTATQVASGVLVVKLNAANNYAQSPVTLSTITFPTQTQAAAGHYGGCWIIQTTATGSSGTFTSYSPYPWYNAADAAVGTIVWANDITTAASSAVDLTKAVNLSVNLSETIGHNITSPLIALLTIKPVAGN